MKASSRSDMQGRDLSAHHEAVPAVLDAEALFRRHAAWVARLVGRLGFQGQDVEDIVQETFLVAHQRGGYRAGPARPTTWLAEIALRVAQSQRRSQRRTTSMDPQSLSSHPSQAPDPSEATAQAQSLARVQQALTSLDLERRTLFVLFELEGEGCDALAASFGVPVGTIYSRLHTARALFLREYERLCAEPLAGRPGRGR